MSIVTRIEDEETRPTFLQVAREKVSKPGGAEQLCVQPAALTLKWMDWVRGGLGEVATECKRFLGYTSQCVYCLDVPAKVQKLGASIIELKASLMVGKAKRIAKKTTDVYVRSIFLAGTIADSVEMLHDLNVISLSSGCLKFLSALGLAGSIALFIDTIQSIGKEITKLMRGDPSAEKIPLGIMRLVAKTALLAISIFGIVSYFYGPALIARWLILSTATLLLTFSVASHFYEKLHAIPEEKTIDL